MIKLFPIVTAMVIPSPLEKKPENILNFAAVFSRKKKPVRAVKGLTGII